MNFLLILISPGLRYQYSYQYILRHVLSILINLTGKQKALQYGSVSTGPKVMKSGMTRGSSMLGVLLRAE